jgi:hypothetical protein
VVNAFTFKSVYEARLTPDAGNFETSFTGFFDNIKILAEEDYQQALILGAMCFTFVIWVFSFLFLLAAILFYVFFLWHWLPRADGGLRGYCARKVNQRLRQIVTAKVNRALAKGEASRFKAAEKNGEKPPMDSFATLPTLPNVGPVGTTFVAAKPRTDDDLPQMPTVGRDETTTTLPVYSSRPGSIEMGVMNQTRPKPSRTGTMASSAPSYSSRAPLVGGAADMGQGQPASPGLYAGSDAGYSNGGPRMNTPASQGGYGRAPSLRNMPSAGSSLRAPPSDYSRSTPAPRQYDAYTPGYDNRSASPAGGYRDRTPGPPRQQPSRSATGPMPMRGPNQQPHRNMTAPGPPRGPTPAQYTPYDGRAPPPTQDYGRSGTPQGQQRGNPYGYDVESQWDRRY